jgi:hypothetical protein
MLSAIMLHVVMLNVIASFQWGFMRDSITWQNSKILKLLLSLVGRCQEGYHEIFFASSLSKKGGKGKKNLRQHMTGYFAVLQ